MELTPRVMQVLPMMADGLSNKEIGRELFISPLTVKSYVSTAIRALNAKNRTHAVAIALRSGLIQ